MKQHIEEICAQEHYTLRSFMRKRRFVDDFRVAHPAVNLHMIEDKIDVQQAFGTIHLAEWCK